jgi:hypothetical protein
LHPAGEEFKQDAKTIIKITIKLIRKGIHFWQAEGGHLKGGKDRLGLRLECLLKKLWSRRQ